jgi:hypothetical protein
MTYDAVDVDLYESHRVHFAFDGNLGKRLNLGSKAIVLTLCLASHGGKNSAVRDWRRICG